MIYFLYGQNDFLKRDKAQQIVNGFKKVHQSGINYKRFDLAQIDVSDVSIFLDTMAMFQEKKLAVLDNCFQIASISEDLAKLFIDKKTATDKEAIVVVVGPEKPKGELFKFLKTNSQLQEFRALEDIKLEQWIINEFAQQGCIANSSVAKKMIFMVGGDMWQLSTEIAKLASYKADKKMVGVDDLDVLIKAKIDNDIFKTIDALAGRNRYSAIALLEKHLSQNEDGFYLLSMFLYQFRNLLRVKDLAQKNHSLATIVQKTKMHPFVARKTYTQAEKFSLDDLKNIHKYFLDLDIKAKTGQIEPAEMLYKLAFSLTY